MCQKQSFGQTKPAGVDQEARWPADHTPRPLGPKSGNGGRPFLAGRPLLAHSYRACTTLKRSQTSGISSQTRHLPERRGGASRRSPSATANFICFSFQRPIRFESTARFVAGCFERRAEARQLIAGSCFSSALARGTLSLVVNGGCCVALCFQRPQK